MVCTAVKSGETGGNVGSGPPSSMQDVASSANQGREPGSKREHHSLPLFLAAAVQREMTVGKDGDLRGWASAELAVLPTGSLSPLHAAVVWVRQVGWPHILMGSRPSWVESKPRAPRPWDLNLVCLKVGPPCSIFSQHFSTVHIKHF